MIKASELRQGNYYLEHRGLHQMDFYDSDQFRTENFEPILLTPEVLDKCGLIKCGIFPDIEYFKIEDGSLYFEDNYTCVDIKYLHQLQNLYFALTGKELQVNL